MPTYRTLDYFNNASSGVFKDNTSGAIDAPHLQDFCQTAFGGLYVDSTAESGTNPSFTGEVGTLKIIDMSAATQNCVVSEPAGIASGDRWGYLIQKQSTTIGSSVFPVAPHWGVEPNNFLINNVTYSKLTSGTGKWGLWQDSEILIFQYIDATVGHQVVYDGIIPMYCTTRLSANNTSNSAGTTTPVGFDTLDEGRGGMEDLTAEYTRVKRTGLYSTYLLLRAHEAVSDGNYYGGLILLNTAQEAFRLIESGGTQDVAGYDLSYNGEATGGDFWEGNFFAQEANRGVDGGNSNRTKFEVVELK